MNAKISLSFICVGAIIYLLLYNLHECTFNEVFGAFGIIFYSNFEIVFLYLIKIFKYYPLEI